MYTGYYAKQAVYETHGLAYVSIALKTPAWYSSRVYHVLSPTWSILQAWKQGEHQGDTAYYRQRYFSEVLGNLDAQTVVKELVRYAGVPQEQIVLLCYEKPTDFCHRHLVAEWLTSNGIPTEEFTATAIHK